MASSTPSIPTQDSTGRSARLTKFFRDVLSGKRTIVNTGDAKLFFESAFSQESAGVCVENIIASRHGLAAVKASVRADLSLDAFHNLTLPFIQYLSHTAVKALGDGQLLWKMLLAVVCPPTMWNALMDHHDDLDERFMLPLAWLAHELLSGPDDEIPDFVAEDLAAVLKKNRLLQAESQDVRRLAYKIQKIINPQSSSKSCETSFSPGGRHDNDHANFRDIAVHPTTDEFLSRERPFYRPSKAVFDADPDARVEIHLDNQYRLLREDMLPEIRHDLQVAMGKKQGSRRQAQILSGLMLDGIRAGDEKFVKRCALSVTCLNGLGELRRYESRKDGASQSQKFLKDNKNYLRHQSFGALLCGNQVCGFAIIDRDLNLLCKAPPVVCLQFSDHLALGKALVALQCASDSRFVLVDTPIFAYEPVLNGLKSIDELPLQDFLLNPSPNQNSGDLAISPGLQRLILKYEGSASDGCKISIQGSSVQLDRWQLESFLAALSASVSLIQGPPGTGKSMLGSLIAKMLYELSDMKILVISYTNHALDQFLEELLDVGIPSRDIVRLGSKYTDRTSDLLLKNYSKPSIGKDSWAAIDLLKSERDEVFHELQTEFARFKDFKVSFDSLMDYLEFSHEDHVFYQAFQLPAVEQKWKQIGKHGKNIRREYLYQQWMKGYSPGIFSKRIPQECEKIWRMPLADRAAQCRKWERDMRQECIDNLQRLARSLDSLHNRLQDLFHEGDVRLLQSKRIIGCTTTAAAMYNKSIRAAKPDVVLVEEAGEILEAHVLTALAPSVKQLILIGDHQQLRPKVNNYALTVERKDGYDLNMSMFERLIKQGHPHTTLATQHRMHPSISLFARALTYPKLLDGPKTAERPAIKGLQDRVIFVNHEQPETQNAAIADRRDPTAKTSKENRFEAIMVLRLVRYLAQQGYGTDKMVVLTPYLGQLRLLQDLLKEENDPVLNDLDSHELIKAGLISHAASKVKKRSIRLSTIDNYQGEESEIVIASLTRGNEQGDIGFMAVPERLNVLITRARNCMIIIGNMETFMASTKGKECWVPFFQLLKDHGNLYDGIPVKCEQHPENVAIVSNPADFDKFCPDGGCSNPCGVLLPCGIHNCERRCHRLPDHSQIQCTKLVDRTCKRLHKLRVECAKKKQRCEKCVEEDKEQERRIKRDLQMEQERLTRQAAYRKSLQAVQDEMEHHRRVIKYMAEEESQKATLTQQRLDLEGLKSAASKMEARKKVEKQKAEGSRKKEMLPQESGAKKASDPVHNEKNPDASRTESNTSRVRDEWEDLKRLEGAQNDALDSVMDMIGLEEVKASFLETKSTVDTKIRQNIDFSKQRFGCVMLGNPGTGKTTVARLYAQFLTSLSVIPGSRFAETTGAKLANLGVSGCQQLVEDLLNDGGGVIFIDEAYQLTSGNSHGGGAVLDYLLPEVENLTGKIVFVLAGYNKQMESFFAHNPGLPSRFPVEMKFADYTDDELLRIFELKMRKACNGLQCEGGTTGLFCRIVARRIGHGRGREGFGNARTVENVVDRIAKRQANRLRRERRAKKEPDDFLLTKEDLIGPKPSEALANSRGWKKLSELIGLKEVKQAVKSLVDSAQENYERELSEQPLIEYSLNKIFLGNPGTGKTTVAKLYGEILVELGYLSKGEVVVKNPSDFVGSALGESEKKTKGILAAVSGKVLVIDEAYGLYTNGNDLYKTAVIDTIVAEVQSNPGDDRCVLLLGYKEQMETMLQNVNPGLSRRFPLQSAFNFEDFNAEQLEQILDLKLKQQGFGITGEAKLVALEMLDRARNRPNFGNAGEVDILLDATKIRHQKRLTLGETTSVQDLEARDFDEKFDRAQSSETNVKKLFEGTVGSEDVVSLLEGFQETVRSLKALSMDPKENIPFNFLFKGPPGTGKTTTARKMGKVFYDMGFLATAEVEECSASDLVAEYVGQTGPKVRALLDKALGRVLFIDEAYRLADGLFAKEAVDELVDSVTKERYCKKLVIILAGYDKDINRLTSVNEGLSSRFPETISFRSLSPRECITLLTTHLAKQKAELKKKKASLDISVLESPGAACTATVSKLFADLAQQASWANARDVKTLASSIFNKMLKCKEELEARRFVLKEGTIIAEMMSLLQERQARGSKATNLMTAPEMAFSPATQTRTRPKTTSATSTSTTTATKVTQEKEPAHQQDPSTPAVAPKSKAQGLDDANRDAGVSDEVWEQLQKDKRAEAEREDEYRKLKEECERASEAERDKIVQRLVEEERRRKEEEAIRLKLSQMGVCPVGYNWIKQASGYRCAGGSHYMSEEHVQGLGT